MPRTTRKSTGKRKTTAKTTAAVEKIPQSHGGALNSGGTPGNKGGGRTPDHVRRIALDSSLDEVVPRLRKIVRFSPEDADAISAGRELLKVAIPSKQEVDIRSHPEAIALASAYRQALDELVPEKADAILTRMGEILGAAA